MGKRCVSCNKKIPLALRFPCKCNNLYCEEHKYTHNCNFNYKENQKKKLESENPKVEFNKMEKI